MTEKLFQSKKEAIISCTGLSVIAILLGYWWLVDNTANIAGHIIAVAVVVLFCALCLPFVRKWIEFWDNSFEDNITANKANKITLLKIFIGLFIASCTFYSIVYFIRVHLGNLEPFSESLEFYKNLDTGNYLAIAEYLYDLSAPAAPERLVFYPAYPIMIRLVSCIIGNYLISAILVSIFLYSLSGCFMYKLLLLDYDHTQAIGAIKFMALLPGAFFFAFPLSESLFLFLCILSIYYTRIEKTFCGAFCGAFAAFTRSLGILLIAPLVFEAFAHKKDLVKRILACMIVPLGTLAYFCINYYVAGSPFAFKIYESTHWGQEFGLFFNTSAYQIDNALADIQTDYYTASLGIWFPNVTWCVMSLILMTFATRRIRASYSVWFIVYYVFAIAPTFLISAPRYLVACLPIYPALAELSKFKRADRALSAICVLASLYYIFAFANLWDVY